MNMYFDSQFEKDQASGHEVVTTNDYFFSSGKVSFEWISVKSECEVNLLYLLFSAP